MNGLVIEQKIRSNQILQNISYILLTHDLCNR